MPKTVDSPRPVPLPGALVVKIGSNTRWQIGQYERLARIDVGCWPRKEVLEHLRKGIADGR